MTGTPGHLLSVRDRAADHLAQIARLFKAGAKITLVVRHPDLEAQGIDADFVLTDDILAGAITALQRRHDAAVPGR